MKKVLCAMAVFMAVVLMITGCTPAHQGQTLAICGSYAVPGMFCFDHRGGTYECDVLETDSQGRILFTYRTESIITKKIECVAVICQKYDRKAVYYYEDICYLISEWTSEDVENLKKMNDWDQPLDHSKMVCKSNKVTLDNCVVKDSKLVYSDLQESCCESLGVEEQQVEALCFLDTNNKDAELYWLEVNEASGEACYFALVNTDYQVHTLRVERTMQSLSELSAFKQDNGWN